MKEPSHHCFELAQRFEDFSPTPYMDSDGQERIGYGTYANIDEEHIDWGVACMRLAAEIRQQWQLLKRYILAPDNLTQGQVDALADMAFNYGNHRVAFKIKGNGEQTKTDLIEQINSGDNEAVAANMLTWNKAYGKENANLTERCRARARLWKG